MNVRPLRRALLAHYDRERRDLPWRGETDPYRVLVSEVMLQQTRVDTVKGYYEAWIRRFPDLETLAAAEVDEVLEAWAGLGYYRRARNLHQAARVVRERAATYPALLPASAEALRALPGIGEYTSGAVASIAFGEAVSAVDGNARRVLARLYDEADPGAAWLRETGAALVDPERPGDWNQGLMELGATICRPSRPCCCACPLAAWCLARQRGTQEARPAPRRKREVPSKLMALAVLVRVGRVMLVRRPLEGLLGGMWAFPEREVDHEREAPRAAVGAAEAAGLTPLTTPAPLAAVHHRFTHLRVTYLPWSLEVSSGTNVAAGGGRTAACDVRLGARPRRVENRSSPARPGVAWVLAHDPPRLALSVAQRRVLEMAAGRGAAAPEAP